ncbi:MAG: serine/threonine-protein kinase [Planctomycetota bacterium]
MDRQLSSINLQPGNELGPYQLKRTLGSGGMGTVYLATQLRLDRDVALKVIKPSRVVNPGAAENFLREAARTAQLNHPHLVAVHDAGRDEATGLVYYAMTYVDGSTLRRVVINQKTIPPEHALRLAHECALGLGHAHQQGLVHRDLKPDNVLISQEKRAMVTDLGLAMDRLGNQRLNSAKTLAIVGTPEYAAPEQSRNPSRAVPASDVFSLGCCLHFMLTGKDPFDGETLLDLVVRVATEEPDGWEDLAPAHRDLLELLMAKDPEDRPADGSEAAEAITLTARGAGTGGKRRSAASIRRRRRRR